LWALEGQKSYPSHHSSWCGRLYLFLTHFESSQRARPWYIKKPIRLPSNFMPTLCSMRTNWQQLDALLRNPDALEVLVWSRGRLVSLQILTNSSFSLVEETHGSLGQCVSFSLIDVGNGFTAYVVFLFFCFLFFPNSQIPEARIELHKNNLFFIGYPPTLPKLESGSSTLQATKYILPPLSQLAH